MKEMTEDAGKFPHPQRLFAPLVSDARKRLRQQVGVPLYNLLSGRAHEGWERYLLRRLYTTSTKVVTQQFQQYCSVRSAFARKQADQQSNEEFAYGEFVGEDPSARLQKILGEFSGLARVLETLIKNWIDTVHEFLERLDADLAELSMHFTSGLFVHPVDELDAGLSDPHRGGRCVVQIKFSDRVSLIYKPRSLAPETHFLVLLEQLNGAGAPYAFRGAQCWDRGEYGWMEYIAPQPCAEFADLQAFYWRAGALLALIYLLRGVDMHQENMIAQGADPVLIDLETIWHPQEHLGIGNQSTAGTVLRTGMLPQINSPAGAAYEWNALARSIDPYRRASQHLPVLAGLVYPASNFLMNILIGFRWIGERVFGEYPLASEFQIHVQAFTRCQRRRVLRSTSWYQSVIERMITLSSLRDAMSFATECRNKSQNGSPITEEEHVALLQMDVPYIEQTVVQGLEETVELPSRNIEDFMRQEVIIADALSGVV